MRIVHNAVALAVVCSLAAASPVGAATCTCTDGAWDAAPSGEGDVVVVVSGDITWGASLPHKVASWTQTGGTVTFETVFPGQGDFELFEVTGDVVLNGGTWTHPGNANTESYRLNVKVGGKMTVAEGVEVTAYRKGYRQGGAGRSARGVTGAAHGGRGYNEHAGERTVCFGSIREPIRIGSTAGNNANTGSEAGGAICLAVGGKISVDGIICADGSQTGSGFYVGSGGSVWITAGSIEGASCGIVSANAGTGPGYAGGGGRVSICLTDDDADFANYAGETTAYGAINSSGVAYTGAGTVYFETKADGIGKGRLVVDGKNIASCDQWFTELIFADQVEGFNPSTIEVKNNGRLWTWDAGSLSPKKLVFSGGGRLRIGSACDLDLSEVEMSGDSASGGVYVSKPINLDLGDELTISGGCLWIASADVVCTGGRSLTLQSDGTLNVSCPFSYPGDILVRAGGKITHLANTADSSHNPTSDYRLDLSIGGDLTVDEGGLIDACACGWPTKVGTGSGSDSWGGGGHGGVGYSSYEMAPSVGECYGSLTKPTSLGSGSSSQYGGAGGGAVKLTVAGDFVNNGLVDADGGLGQYGAGPGGSVWITAKTLAGAGKIEANGNGTNCVNKTCSHAAGAGGRVAVWLTDPAADFSVFTGAITAYGSRGGFSHAAGPGTVYLKTGAQAENEGTLYVDNGTVPANTTTDIGRYVTDAEVGSVVIAANGRLRLRDSSVLTVHGDISCAGSFTAIDDATLVFAGSGASSVDCDLNVSRLTCMEPGKEIVFDADRTVTVGKKLTLEGEEGNLVTVRTTKGSMWNLVVGAEAEQSVKRVRVEGCDASAGAEIIATDSEKDDATVNWKTVNVVPGETITWTGAAGATGWTLPANWDKERPPAETDFVVINSAAVQPILTADVVVSNLTIAAGASLALDGFDLAVNGDLIVNGRLTASAVERIRVTGNVVFGTNAFVKDHSTVTLVGSAAQSFFAGGNSFYNLVFDNTSADGVTVGSSFEANYLTVAPEVPTAISFASGVTVTVGASLALAGDATAKNLTLKPAVADATWDLMVKGTAEIRGVTVSGSQATGNDVFASDSVDAGGNAKWHFGTFSAAKWVGETSDAFDEPSNWEGGVVPDASTAIEIDTAKPLKITSETTVREIVVGGIAAASVAVKAPLTVVGAMVLRDRATVTADAKVTVGGSLVMNAGSTLTYTGKSAASRLELEVAGDVSVDEGAFITADEKGPTDSYLGSANNSGASHGGMGGTHGTAANCYGSIFCPTNAGSSAANDSAGGGVIRMTVAGALVVDGAIRANGGYRDGWYGTSGGSVWLTCGRFLGNGTVSANGGSSANTYRGAGGRVAVYLTDPGASFNDFAGRVAADPSDLKGAPGTVYVQTADEADYCGTVKIVNNPNAVEFAGSEQGTFVQYPMRSRSAADPQRGKMKIELGERVRFSLTEDATIGKLVVNGERPKIFLNGHTLKVRKVASKAEQERISARVQDADKGGGIIWAQGLRVVVK